MQRNNDELNAIYNSLETYFGADIRFQWEKEIGRGSNGISYQFKYTDLKEGESKLLPHHITKRVVLKIAPDDYAISRSVPGQIENVLGGAVIDSDDNHRPLFDTNPDEDFLASAGIENESSSQDSGKGRNSEATKQLANELRLLQDFAGSHHVVSLVEVKRDPLGKEMSKEKYGVRQHDMNNWIYMEYLENGTLGDFIINYRQQYPGKTLPNRLLWRFFMCLVRGCLVLAYGPESEKYTWAELDADLGQADIGNLAHFDIHDGNVMLGNVLPAIQPSEHEITPILKLIDFGSADILNENEPKNQRAVLEEEYEDGWEYNIYDIGHMMTSLILLDSNPQLPRVTRRSNTDPPEMQYTETVRVQDEVFHTSGIQLVPNNETLQDVDLELKLLVCACLAVDPRCRPTPTDLAAQIGRHIATEDATKAGETNADISIILEGVIFNASPIGALGVAQNTSQKRRKFLNGEEQ
ncbi:uncharacterized protein BCR38DRAFT_509083 [Pseudomassariella vexata]|uniref:Protein kinase domain-containing protein n=1 Tax=Pseudomassariella vexata TaxID=1141098 RepID=A0A1Y2D631_9PEZI|nr:uncharacterized protein BCR38DRAFT_509083 [Pseudomassariella vexata]ORY54710.1 hypothetical protein BCR38DRAFT_509083 [Pseudomassariella vexata]